MGALILGGIAALGAVVWHLQRSRPQPLRLSFARLVADPPLATAPERRLHPSLPWRSAGFWLRMLLLVAALAVLMDRLPKGAGADGQRIGLRLVVDAGDTMRLPGAAAGGQSRIALAYAAALAAAAEVPAGAQGVPFCAELVVVGAGGSAPLPLTAMEAPQAQPVAVPGSRLLAAARLQSQLCPPTHALILTDQPRPAGQGPALSAALAPGQGSATGGPGGTVEAPGPADGAGTGSGTGIESGTIQPPDQPSGPEPEGATAGPQILWHQIGAPLENTGLRGVRLRRTGLAGVGALPGASGADGLASAATAMIEIDIHGFPPPGHPLVVTLETPQGGVRLVAEPDLQGPGQVARLPFAGPGRYRASLEIGGGWDGDDHLVFQLPAVAGPALDWRLDLPPPAMALDPEGLLVAPLDGGLALAADRPALLVYDGWTQPRPAASDTSAPDASASDAPGTGAATIGRFLEDPLVRALNLDAFEALLPQPITLPPGFHPVLEASQPGMVHIARRSQPPAVLVPALAEGPARALSETLFYTALAELSQPGPIQPDRVWEGADGRRIDEAWRRSDLARPLAAPDPLAGIMPRAADAGQERLWPWALVLALAALLAERVLALRGLARGRDASAAAPLGQARPGLGRADGRKSPGRGRHAV